MCNGNARIYLILVQPSIPVFLIVKSGFVSSYFKSRIMRYRRSVLTVSNKLVRLLLIFFFPQLIVFPFPSLKCRRDGCLGIRGKKVQRKVFLIPMHGKRNND